MGKLHLIKIGLKCPDCDVLLADTHNIYYCDKKCCQYDIIKAFMPFGHCSYSCPKCYNTYYWNEEEENGIKM